MKSTGPVNSATTENSNQGNRSPMPHARRKVVLALSRHANVILYLGIHFEDVLMRRYRVHGKNLGELLHNARLPSRQNTLLHQFRGLRNDFAHAQGRSVLSDVPGTVSLVNEIEEYFVQRIAGYSPTFVAESDFEEAETDEEISKFVEIPPEQSRILPPFLRIALWIMGTMLAITFLFGSLTSTRSYSQVEGWLFKYHYRTTVESPSGYFWLIVCAAILVVASAVLPWLWSRCLRKPGVAATPCPDTRES